MAMVEENNSYKESLDRLKEIVKEVQNKDLDLEESLDLLEEGVNLAHVCISRVDTTEALTDEDKSEPEPETENIEDEEEVDNENNLSQ